MPVRFTRWRVLWVWFLSVACLAGAVLAQEPAVQIFDMRSDMGVMEDFGPRGVAWTPQGQLLVVDRRYPVFHIFDLQGRRFKFLDHPQSVPAVYYNALCPLKENQYLATGSHYHVKNNNRFVSNRSFIHLMELAGEKWTENSGKLNLSPDRALRATGYFGESCTNCMEISGLATDSKHNRIFFGCSRPLQPDGTVMIWEGKLDLFLSQSRDFQLTLLKTDLKPETAAGVNTPFFLNDLQYIPDRGLALLMASEDHEEKQFGSSQIWFLRGGFAPAKLVRKDIAPGNRGCGLAVRPVNDKGEYQAAIVCDNNMEDSKTPSRLVLVPGIHFPVR